MAMVTPRALCGHVPFSERTPRGNFDPQAYFRETMLVGKGGAANDRADAA